ncbi:MAG TPA: autotransporter-associated beta strand repeat-containing protein [Candidatus Binataceae bacterium]|nr:autotransporter-associated beta strand repeat-containing protein [Candidatus Binataceae bacterium]
MRINNCKWLVVCISAGSLKISSAASASWILNPVNSDWYTAANWSPPNVPTDLAEFHVSNQPSITFSVDGTTNISQILFGTDASSYTFSVAPGQALGVEGDGIINSSGQIQTFVAEAGDSGSFAEVFLTLDATASELVSFTSAGASSAGGGAGEIAFVDFASANGSTIVNEGGRVIGAAGGLAMFAISADAGNATISNEAGVVTGSLGGTTQFTFSSRAATAVITSEGATVSGAGGGITTFEDTSNAGSAVLIANGGANGGSGGSIEFVENSSGVSARVEVFGNGKLDISGLTNSSLGIGSLEGDGQVFLGNKKLNVGLNNLSTLFSGTIQNNGSLGKMGAGTLTLSGANSYTGATTVSAGALKIANRTGSATGTGAVTVNAGSLGGRGTIAGATTIGTGSGAGAFLEPSVGAMQPATTTIQSLLTFKADGSYTYKVNTKKARADEVVANGVTIESGAQFNFSAIANKRLPLGSVFVAISNTSASPISGTFANLADGSIFTAGKNKYQASYTGGDGNDLTLTVVP